MAGVALPASRTARASAVRLAPGLALAVAAAVAAPSSPLLPAPSGGLETALSALALAACFAAGLARPVAAFYGVLVLTTLEGAIRRWGHNDVTVFLLKDFLLLGVYAGVLPRLDRARLRRPWWLVAPLAGLVALAAVYVVRNPSHGGAIVGLRSYVIYLPLLWAAPAIVRDARRANALVLLVVALGAVESGLGIVQALAGPGVLNRLVSGAQPALLTVADRVYLRPTGTFMQVANLSDFVVFAALACFALLVWRREARTVRLALASLAVLGGAVVYTGARTLLASLLLVVVAATGVLAAGRRWGTAAAGPAALVAGVLVMLVVVPFASSRAVPQVKEWLGIAAAPTFDERTAKRVEILYGGRSVPFRIDLVHATPRGGGTLAAVAADPSGGRYLIVVRRPATPPRLRVVSIRTQIGGAADAPGVAGGFLGRAVDINRGGDTSGTSLPLWSGRLKPQLELIGDQGLAGRGTGTMTLGAEYANPGHALAGESSYAKAAWELGLPGLALLVWLLAAAAALSVLGAIRAPGWLRPCAAVGAGAAFLVPLWMTITFAIDFPIVAVLYFTFVGLAVAAAADRPPAAAAAP